MFKHIHSAESQSTITNVDDKMIQPNAVDVRLDRVFRMLPTRCIIGPESIEEDNNGNETKQHRQSEEVFPDSNGVFLLQPGAYEITTLHNVKIGDDECGWVQTRSSLSRNNCLIFGGIFDSSYHGAMALSLQVGVGELAIYKHTRIGQFIIGGANTSHPYDGDYGFDADGNPKEMEAKYHT